MIDTENSIGYDTSNGSPLLTLSLLCSLPSWYHGALSRTEAESTLRHCAEGSYLVRSLHLARHQYSLALKWVPTPCCKAAPLRIVLVWNASYFFI